MVSAFLLWIGSSAGSLIVHVNMLWGAYPVKTRYMPVCFVLEGNSEKL
jgi:hypothetical protein